ncbi:hypothetical protein [Microbacterium ginsengisoli]|nr:hypothetical protein [Microbacteriaceae bacterium K1510]
MKRLRKDIRGNAYLTAAAVIITPIIIGVIGFAALGMLRTGGNVIDVFFRNAQLSSMSESFKQDVHNATAITAVDQTQLTTYDQPSARDAYYLAPTGGAPTVCVKNVWSLTKASDGSFTLQVATSTFSTGSCTSTIVSTQTTQLTGFPSASFAYQNAAGRTITFTSGVAAAPDYTIQPAGVSTQDWGYSGIGFVTLTGTLNQPIGTSPVRVFGQTSMRATQTTPYTIPPAPTVPVVTASLNGSSGVGTVAAVTCQAGSTAQYHLRASSTQTSTAGTWSAFSAWGTGTTLTAALGEGALYSFSAEARCVNSSTSSAAVASNVATVTSPVTTPATPTVTVNGSAPDAAVWSWTGASCASGATLSYSVAQYRDGPATWGAWSATTTAATLTRNTAQQGYDYQVKVRAICATSQASSPWSADSAAVSFIRAIDPPQAPTVTQSLSTGASYNTVTFTDVATGTCGPGTSMKFTDQYMDNAWTLSWFNKATDANASAFTFYSYDGVKITYQTSAACINLATTRRSASVATNSVRDEPVQDPKWVGWTMVRDSTYANIAYFTPAVTCRSFTGRYGNLVEASWDFAWASGQPRAGLTGWYVSPPAWRISNTYNVSGGINQSKNIWSGQRFEANAQLWCYNSTTSAKSANSVTNDSGIWTAP